MRRKVFIAYASPDKQITKKLAEELSPHHDIWYDDSLRQSIGQKWWDNILDEIEKADAFFFLISRDALESPYCTAEWAEAERLRKPIFPIVVRAKTDIPPYLNEYQSIDLSGGITDQHIEDIRSSLENPNLYEDQPESAGKERTPLPSSLDQETNWVKWGVIVSVLTLFVLLAQPVIADWLADDPAPIVQAETETSPPPTESETPVSTASVEPTIEITPTRTHTNIPPTDDPVATLVPAPSVDIAIFIDRDSLTVSVTVEGSVSLEGMGFEVVVDDVREAVYLEDFPAMESIRFDSIRAPICFRLLRDGSAPSLPSECDPDRTAIQRLSDADVFWYDAIQNSTHTLQILSELRPVDLCLAGQSRCDLSFQASY